MVDVSKNVVAVLLILVVLVSGLGTWTLLSKEVLQPTRPASTDSSVTLDIQNQPSDLGNVELTIAGTTNG